MIYDVRCTLAKGYNERRSVTNAFLSYLTTFQQGPHKDYLSLCALPHGDP